MPLNILIKNITVVDGSGEPGFIADVGVEQDRISLIGQAQATTADKTIEGQGKVLCPGFVDIHSHSDYYLLINPQGESKLRQGVTTEVGGNCGYSAAPIGGKILAERQRQYQENYSLDLDWQSLSQYRKRLEDSRIAINYAPLIGHNTIRATVMGVENREPTFQELSQMEQLVEQGMRDGALGISSGLVYPPACYAKAAELVSLCRIVARYGGIFTCHIRNEGTRLTEALTEVIGIAESAPIPLQISHLKTSGSLNWKKLPQALELIEQAQNRGVQITADRYPYLASNAGLQVLLPDWAFEGGVTVQLNRLQDHAVRKRLTEEIILNHPDEEYWDKVLISQVNSAKNQHWAGMTVAEASCLQDKTPVDFVLDLLIQEKMQVEAIFFTMNEDNLHTILKRPYVLIGSDASVRAHYGPLNQGKPHPRAFGTFPRVLGHYVRQEGILKLEEAVHKMTAAPCRKLGLNRRGLIRQDFAADLVIFDPARITDTATYQEPVQYPLGIEYVIVNGAIALACGEPTGLRAGRVLGT
ncbi:MAG: D-aminoacylase [Candidatus Schekmanbacteria bacterium]|nr:D-aminoacylase [Candidatus Schekmanbacteria bacterium]